MNQDVTPEIKKQVVDQLTKKELLKQFVDKQDISASDEEIQAEIEKIKFFLQNNPSNAGKSLDEILDAQGSSISELQAEVSRALALSKYLKSTVTDADKRSYFDANKDAFNGARVKASHVLIDTRDLKTDAEKEEAKKKIEMVKIEINNGADFAEMAKKYSNCPSAEKGGDIGFFQRKGSIVEEFAVVAFAMEIGEISEPVETQFGYHIIMITDKEEGKDVSYEDVSDMVDFVYMQIKTEELLTELYGKAEIEMML
jgi:parvulin-like peptidyl-prolyl isomerase